jgi:hypothetical protein
MQRSHGVSDWTLFLDFNGVLTNTRARQRRSIEASYAEDRFFAPENIEALNRLCTELPVGGIVVTSTWRLGQSLESLRELLQGEGFSHPHLLKAATIALGSRADEIDHFIANRDLERWLILDDMSLGTRFGERFFQTSPAVGFTEAMCDEVVRSLQSVS